MHAYEHGFVCKCPDGVTRRLYPRIFTYSADYPEKQVPASSQYMRNSRLTFSLSESSWSPSGISVFAHVRDVSSSERIFLTLARSVTRHVVASSVAGMMSCGKSWFKRPNDISMANASPSPLPRSSACSVQCPLFQPKSVSPLCPLSDCAAHVQLILERLFHPPRASWIRFSSDLYCGYLARV
jgi:hypothetical protein